MRSKALWTVGLVALVAALVPIPGAEARIKTLRPGKAMFWDGPLIESANGKTYTYSFRLPHPGRRLRIGVDHPKIGDSFNVSITDPAGDQSASFTVGPASTPRSACSSIRIQGLGGSRSDRRRLPTQLFE